jgi:hypothetical protein
MASEVLIRGTYTGRQRLEEMASCEIVAAGLCIHRMAECAQLLTAFLLLQLLVVHQVFISVSIPDALLGHL